MAEPLPRPRYLHESTVAGSSMWVWGGRDHSGHFFQRSAVSVYDPVVNLWRKQEARASAAATIPPSSAGSRCTAVGTTIYSYGGQGKDGGCLDEVYALDTNTVTWRKVNVRDKKPAPRASCGLCSTEGRLLMFGGIGSTIEEEQLQEGVQYILDGKNTLNNVFYELNVATGENVTD